MLRAKGERVFEMERFLRFAATRGVAADGLEPAVDLFVREHGGRRVATIDPFGFLPNVARRVVSFPVRAAEHLWALPPDWAERPRPVDADVASPHC